MPFEHEVNNITLAKLITKSSSGMICFHSLQQGLSQIFRIVGCHAESRSKQPRFVLALVMSRAKTIVP